MLWLVVVVLAACTAPAPPTLAPGAIDDSTGPADPERKSSLTVFAAASLTDAFREIGQAFEAAHPGVDVEFNFAGSQRLALQIELGAEADVFASADERNVDRLVAAGLIPPAAAVTFAHNRMVVILPKGNPGKIESLKDLARPGLKLLLAGEQVPAGAYARQALANLASDPAYGSAYKEAVLQNVISNEESVKQVVAKVQLGEADAGLVYGSDVTPSLAGDLDVIEIPERFNVEATYSIAILETAAGAELARQFIQYVLGPDGQRILERWSLQAP